MGGSVHFDSFLNGPTPASFLFIFVLFQHNLYRKTVIVSGIRTLIVVVEGEHADHLTTTTAHKFWVFIFSQSSHRSIIRFWDQLFATIVSSIVFKVSLPWSKSLPIPRLGKILEQVEEDEAKANELEQVGQHRDRWQVSQILKFTSVVKSKIIF